MREIWKPCPGYEKFYLISNKGQVKSLRHKTVKIMTHCLRMGYPSVILSNENGWKHKRVHRLLALAFIDNPQNKPNVDHIDRNPLNYSLSNLRWCHQGENVRFSRDVKIWEEAIQIIKTSKDDQDETSILKRNLTERFRITRYKPKDRNPVTRCKKPIQRHLTTF